MGKVAGIQANGQGMFTVNARYANRQKTENNAKGNGKKSGTAVFAGDLNMEQDSIFAKKQKAQRQAMKIISDVFQSDLKTDAQQEQRLQNIAKLKQENADSKDKLKDIESMQKDLMEEYGVTEDSQEQKDLEILRKVKNSKDPFAEDTLTDEEQQRYEEMKEQGMTEYQEKILAWDDEAESIKSRMSDNEKNIVKEEEAYKDTKMELLKKSPMTGAKEQAEEILEAACKEMIGDLYNEAKEHIDEKTEEVKEEQKKKTEEKKEEEKKEAAQEAEKLEQEIMLQRTQEPSECRIASLKAKAQSHNLPQESVDDSMALELAEHEDRYTGMGQEMKELLEKMKLLQEDLKGAAVDDAI